MCLPACSLPSCVVATVIGREKDGGPRRTPVNADAATCGHRWRARCHACCPHRRYRRARVTKLFTTVTRSASLAAHVRCCPTMSYSLVAHSVHTLLKA